MNKFLNIFILLLTTVASFAINDSLKLLCNKNNQSPTGQYTGKGRVMMGFAGAVSSPVVFTNVTVNNDMQVVAGRMDVRSKGIDNWLNQQNAGFFNVGDDETEYTTSTTNPAITVNTSNNTINIDGNTYPLDNNYGNTITDGGGNITIVTPSGQVITVGSTTGPPIPTNKKYINTVFGSANFNATAQQLYGYDKFTFSQWNNWHEKTTDIATNAQIPVDWKSVQTKKYDVVELNIQLTNAFNADSVFVRSATGTIYKQQKLNGKRFIYFVGSEPHKSQELFASIHSGDSIINIGKLHTINYELQNKVVNLVPFNNTKTLNAQQLQNQLNRRYAQALIKWTVNIKPALTATTADWDLNTNNKLNCGSSLFAKYSNEMQALNTKLRTQSYYTKDELYIIASGTAPDSLQNGLLGEMPRNRNIGYVFTNTNPSDSVFTQVVAHELGHGYATLEHTFPTVAQGSCNNLMDYPATLNMARFQWDLCQEPNELAGLLDGQNEFAMYSNTVKTDLYNLYNLTESSSCSERALERAGLSFAKNFSILMSVYTASAEYLICTTEEDKLPTGANYPTRFSYGFANEIVNSLDIDAMADAITNAALEDIKQNLDCLFDKRNILTQIFCQNCADTTALKAQLKCILGIDVQEMDALLRQAFEYAKTNYNNAYTHGQVTAFVVSALLPVIGEAKFATLPKVLSRIKNVSLRQKLATLASKIKNKSITQVIEILKVNGGSVFGKNIINGISGFSDNITNLASQQNINLATFKNIEEFSVTDLLQLQTQNLNKINSIRNSIPLPDATTLMQKVIPKSDIQKYLSGQYKSCKGFMSTAKDSKHLNSFDDIYYGMRLDYQGSAFSISDGSCGVIRFKAPNSNTAIVPRSSNNVIAGVDDAPFPYTGHGFTSGTNGRLGVPEWKMNSFADFQNGEAELYEVFSNGTETLKAKFDKQLGQFVPVQ